MVFTLAFFGFRASLLFLIWPLAMANLLGCRTLQLYYSSNASPSQGCADRCVSQPLAPLS